MSDHGPVLHGEILLPGEIEAPRRSVTVLSYPFLVVLEEHEARPGESVAALLKRVSFDCERLPTTVRCDGGYYLREDWPLLIIDDFGEVVIETTPMDFGGGGDNTGKLVLSVVAAIALAVIAPYAAGAVFAAGTAAFYALQAAIIIGGNLAISYFMAGKDKKKVEDQQLSTLNIGGQRASLGQARHVLYGKMRWAPVLAATDYSDFGAAVRNTAGNVSVADPDSAQKRRTFKLLWITEGTSVIEKIELGRTTVWTSGGGVDASFVGQLEVEIVEAGDPVTLFPVTTHQAADPTGIEFFYDPNDPIIGQRPPNNWLGPYVTNPPNTTAYRLSVDFVMQQGFQTTNSNGNVKTIPVVIIVEYRPIDNAGAPTGAWATLFERTYQGGQKPAAFTEEVDVTPGRYELRARRNSAITGTGAPSCQWVGIRSVLQGNDTFPGQVVAIKTVAGRQFAQFQSSPFNVTATRVLPVWNGSAWVDTATRNPVWAARDILVADYGALWSASKLDSNADLLALANACASRSETFDYVFTGETKVSEALSYALAAFRGFWRQIFDKVSFVRDEAQPIPTHFIPSHRIVDGTIEEEFTYPQPDAVDGIRIEYRDEAAGFEMADVVYPSNAIRPEAHQLPGVTNRAIANKIAAYLWLHMTGPARRVLRFQTARDGRFWLRQTRVAISAPQFGETVVVANVTAYDSGTRTVTVNQQIQWPAAGPYYLELRSKSGGYVGPIVCTKGATANTAVLDATSLASVEAALLAAGRDEVTFLSAVTVPSNAERAIVAISTAGVTSIMVTNVEPDGEDRVTVTGIDYDASLYAAADNPTGAPPLPVVTKPTVEVPLIADLLAYYTPAIVGSVLLASWTPTVHAVGGYRVRLSFDAGVTEGEVYPTSDPVISINVNFPAAVRVRVSGVMADGSEGPGATYSVAAGDATVQPTPGTVGTVQFDAIATGLIVDVPRAFDTNALDNAIRERIETVQGEINAARRDGAIDGRVATVVESVRDLSVGTSQTLANFNETITLVVTDTTAIAARVTNVEAEIDDPGTGLNAAHARITTEEIARSAEDLALAADITDLQATVVDQLGAAAAAELRSVSLVAAGEAAQLENMIGEAVMRGGRDRYIDQVAGQLDGRLAAVALRVDTVKAETDGLGAGVAEITYALTTQQVAQAGQITAINATIEDPVTGLPAAHAAVTAEAVARAAADSAIAGDVTALDTRLDVVEGGGAPLSAAAGLTITNITASSTIESLNAAIEEAIRRAARDSQLDQSIAGVSTSVVSLAQQVLTLTASVGGQLAVVNEVTTALATDNLAQASQITSIQAQSNAGTASGSIRFTATSAPSGVTARYAVEVRTSTGPDVFAAAGLYLDVIGSASKITIAADDVMAQTNAFTVSNPIIRNGIPIEGRQSFITISVTPTGWGGAAVNMTGFLGATPDAGYFDGSTYFTGSGATANGSRSVRDGTSLFGELSVRVGLTEHQVVFRNDGTAYMRTPLVGGGYTTYEMGPVVSPFALNPTLLGYALNDKWKSPPGAISLKGYISTGFDVSVGLPIRVPNGAANLVAKLWGGGGAGGDTGFVGGPGHFHGATIPVTPGEWLWLIVGGAGHVATGHGRAPGFGGEVFHYDANYWRGAGGLTGLWRPSASGILGQSQALLIAGGGGSAAKSAHGGAGGHGSEAGQNGLTGNFGSMRGVDGGETNATVTVTGAAGGGGYQGGGNYGGSATTAAGRGGTGFSHASNTSVTSTVGTRGTVTAPNNADADYVGNYGDGGAAQADGKDGFAVLKFTS